VDHDMVSKDVDIPIIFYGDGFQSSLVVLPTPTLDPRHRSDRNRIRRITFLA
jgi:hypothetical protein